jgi:hypothetical protein
MKSNLRKFIPLVMMLALVSTGCGQKTASQDGVKPPVAAVAAVQKTQANVYKGEVVGKSNKAKTISIQVGKGDKAKTIMVNFDDNTKGVEHASKGHASIIFYELRDGQPWATVVKPKLAKLPQGAIEIKTAALMEMMASNTDFTLVDARPATRYAAAHISGAVNIGTKEYKEKAGSLLPKDKGKLLVLYCGGPT